MLKLVLLGSQEEAGNQHSARRRKRKRKWFLARSMESEELPLTTSFSPAAAAPMRERRTALSSLPSTCFSARHLHVSSSAAAFSHQKGGMVSRVWCARCALHDLFLYAVITS